MTTTTTMVMMMMVMVMHVDAMMMSEHGFVSWFHPMRSLMRDQSEHSEQLISVSVT